MRTPRRFWAVFYGHSTCRYCESIVDHRPHRYDFGDGKFYHCHGKVGGAR